MTPNKGLGKKPPIEQFIFALTNHVVFRFFTGHHVNFIRFNGNLQINDLKNYVKFEDL